MADDITELIAAASAGDRDAFEAVASWAYDRLEKAAAYHMKRHFGTGLHGVTLEPAALVNETFLKLLRDFGEGRAARRGFSDRRHFVAFANKVMARALIDYHRRRGRAKRGGGQLRVSLSGLEAGSEATGALQDLTAALEALEALDGRKAETVKLRLLWGLENREIAEVLEVSLATTERDWRFSRAWLADRLRLRPSSPEPPPEPEPSP